MKVLLHINTYFRPLLLNPNLLTKLANPKTYALQNSRFARGHFACYSLLYRHLIPFHQFFCTSSTPNFSCQILVAAIFTRWKFRKNPVSSITDIVLRYFSRKLTHPYSIYGTTSWMVYLSVLSRIFFPLYSIDYSFISSHLKQKNVSNDENAGIILRSQCK